MSELTVDELLDHLEKARAELYECIEQRDRLRAVVEAARDAWCALENIQYDGSQGWVRVARKTLANVLAALEADDAKR